jgi:hypothetical protein
MWDFVPHFVPHHASGIPGNDDVSGQGVEADLGVGLARPTSLSTSPSPA